MISGKNESVFNIMPQKRVSSAFIYGDSFPKNDFFKSTLALFPGSGCEG